MKMTRVNIENKYISMVDYHFSITLNNNCLFLVTTEDEDDIRYSLTDLLADDPDDDSSKSNVGDDAAQPSIKIGCGEEQYACGDQCYPTMKFNGKPLQYRCENNVLDKSKFTVKLNFHFDTIEETDNFFKNGARVVFDD